MVLGFIFGGIALVNLVAVILPPHGAFDIVGVGLFLYMGYLSYEKFSDAVKKR